jgi:phosphoribosylformylglycinamidine synthase
MVKLGLLPALDGVWFKRKSSLAHNSSARFENRWCRLKVNASSPCVFTRGLKTLYLPVRHGEGRFVTEDAATMRRLQKENLITIQYTHPETEEVTQEYPYNPNGSPLGIAGICDPSGRVFGLMPHPEAYNHPTNHPAWSRGETATPGTSVFENGVRWLKESA